MSQADIRTGKAVQRREELEKRTEANAKRCVNDDEKRYNLPTLGKHGPEIPDAVMRQRAIDGTDPITGKDLENPDFDFAPLFDNDDEHDYTSCVWNSEEVDSPRGFFEDIYRVACEVWKEAIEKAESENQ
ncbi:hypothetical protein [Pseudomonas syringae]|nr:hypothetical protein [Pseudomonas syringae]